MNPRMLVITLLSVTWTTASGLPCAQMFPSQSPPLSVNSVRPSDVSVLATTGLYTYNTDLSTVLSRLTELMTLFNPALVSPLTDSYSSPFVQQRTMLEQAKDLTLYLQNNEVIDLDADWKLVLLFVQVDGLCALEQQQVQSGVQALVDEVDQALQLLYSELKRTIVSVALWDGEHQAFQTRTNPATVTSDGEARVVRATLTQSLQVSLEELLVKRRWYGDRGDFTVTLQNTPLVRDVSSSARAKLLSEAETSQQTDELLLQMWANLLQPTQDQDTMDGRGVVSTLPCPTEERPFLRTEDNSPTDRHSPVSPLLYSVTGTEMLCEDLGPSDSVPTTVHELRPVDVSVVAALGDSLTAGNGIASSPENILDVLRQYRGLSWSVGGDGNLTTVTTLPNLIKYFNPNVTGFSVGMGKQNSENAFLNQAVAGAKTKELLPQARALVARMKNDSRIDFKNDWKVITVFIGGNDLCDFCYNSLLFSKENYARYLRETLDYLHREVPRALVNLVEPMFISPLKEMHTDPSLNCPTWLVKIVCPCVVLSKPNSNAVQKLEEINRNYQRVLREVVESGHYDNRSDFTVVAQPFFRDVVLPRLPNGRPDRSYFSADCFHLSQKAQTIMARALWNNMLEPLGNKTSKQDFTVDIELKCPTRSSPYIRTYKNSDYTYSGPPPTPTPIQNWGSDFSCVNLSPSDTVPTSVHKLRPADIMVVAALGDSVTAGTAAKAKTFFELNRNYPGLSWSIGGEKTLNTTTTLPNILKKFNSALKGFSKGSLPRQKGFNMAARGARTSDIPDQVQALVKALKEDKEVDFEKDWKLVTIFVGASDLCHYCTDQNNLSPKNYSHNLMLSLDTLYHEVPRLLVNMVEIWQIHPLKTINNNTLTCALLPMMNCPCVINAAENSPELDEIKQINLQYQAETQYLVSGDRYDGKEDFAVVLQPFLHNYFVPRVGMGESDISFFSVDCFHISDRAHSEMAVALWNNMLEPVGRKQAFNNFTYDRSKINCPSEASPFIFTKQNSLKSPTICSSSIPVWVPVVAGIVSLLAGITVGYLFLHCRQQRSNKKVKKLEMMGTLF
ncbi:phospholipase B1, membrane-associated [Cynoglossus semilaevis]|uniref:phospholipase B1, membrane-associated n=1 Tax=Cynoglossus semilaevis TaxID=244447 RepID=UPI0004980E36|nr:phospholipase B1, membrane-associated [Cynoglossus semilaevis]XP_024912456.1 phospholipase B1, membrane-associated [Cynoglossus semilaevis]XP_024912457.1 phospholipase B1, membrane-associated [Cynoglossus semilaevis]